MKITYVQYRYSKMYNLSIRVQWKKVGLITIVRYSNKKLLNDNLKIVYKSLIKNQLARYLHCESL